MGSNNVPDPLMPQVGGAIIHPEAGEFKVLKSLASGPFSDVFKVLHVKGNERYAMKCEKDEGTIRPVLKLDVYVLTQMKVNNKGVGFPKLVCAGRTGYYKYAIMQLVGADLGKLRRAMPEKKFTIGTALKVCLQTLNRIETLHDLGWLCRDIKAPNFAIGRGPDTATVFMLDFGFARRYKDKQGNLLPPRNAAALLGTIHYASLASHYNQEQCRRDDLESWLYMIIEITGGPLPWHHMEAFKQHKMIGEAKKFARGGGRAKLFENCPKEYDEIMDIIDQCQFFERPNYHKIATVLESAMARLQVDRNAVLDWMADDGALIKKASVIGDLGESNLLSVRMKELHDQEKNKPPMLEEIEDIPMAKPVDVSTLPAVIPVPQPGELTAASPTPEAHTPPIPPA